MNEHPLRYRLLWTWDAWICNPFSPESYVAEYRHLIEFAARTGYNGIIIWGFIDDRHGGETAAREIARCGKKCGVRIIPGIGAGGYGGFVTSSGHRFHLPDFLKNSPHLRAIPRAHPSTPSNELLCLYQPESLAWLREGAAWLTQNFEISGVNIETNEADCIDVCEFADHASRLEPNRLRYAASFTDLAIAVPPIFQEIKRFHPDAWITYATYEPPWWRREEDAHILKDIPAHAIAQWNIELDVADNPLPSPVKQNVSLIHSGGWSYHLALFPPLWAFTQYRCFYPNLHQARTFSANQHKLGVDGFVLGNVGSPIMPDNEISYLAYMEFSRNPNMTVDEFSERYISALYGRQAEPSVKQLFLAQTLLHEKVSATWKSFARLISTPRGSYTTTPAQPCVELVPADESDIHRLMDQIALARRAWKVASDGGKRRLETIIQLLEEYRIVAEISRDSRLAGLSGEQLALQIAHLSAESPLPREIYTCSPQL